MSFVVKLLVGKMSVLQKCDIILQCNAIHGSVSTVCTQCMAYVLHYWTANMFMQIFFRNNVCILKIKYIM